MAALAVLSLLALLATVGPLAAAQPQPTATAAAKAPGGTPASSPAGVICADPDLSTLCRIIRAAGIGKGAARLKGTTYPDTVFAPVDSAFTRDANKVAHELSLRSFELIYTTPKAADRLLQNLIIPNQAIGSKAFKNDAKYKSLLGQNLEFDSALFTKQFYIKSEEISALITKPDIPAGRAVVHKVDRVPVPDDFL